MKTIRLVLGDQLSRSISSLRDINPDHDLVLMLEVLEENQYVRHHQQKFVLVLSAMRHFAAALRAEGIPIEYIHLDNENNSGSFTGELVRAITRHQVDRIIVTEPGEWRVWEMMQAWQQDLGLQIEIRPDDRFLCSRDEFARWAEGRKTLRMEHFYHLMRHKTGWLMKSTQPEGGRWNYDSENRRRLPADLKAYGQGSIPLSSAEGFIRQILGWREYMRGIYWQEMPGYALTNYFDVHCHLPDFYWNGETDLNCLRQVIQTTQHNAYAHHIQRLMVTGNFAQLAGIEPGQVGEWYLMVYADAFDWVELPNTHGMVLFADGGLLASKPYAASGAYIQRMSDYCEVCRYSPKIKLGPQACPFNYLYWNFLIANQPLLQSNPRMSLPYQTLAKMTNDHKEQIRKEAKQFLNSLITDYDEKNQNES